MSLSVTDSLLVKKKAKEIVDALVTDGIPYAAVRESEMRKFVAADERYVTDLLDQIKEAYGDDEGECVLWLLRCLFVGTTSVDKIVEDVTYVSYVERSEDFLLMWAKATLWVELIENVNKDPFTYGYTYDSMIREVLSVLEEYVRTLKLSDVLKKLKRRFVD